MSEKERYWSVMMNPNYQRINLYMNQTALKQICFVFLCMLMLLTFPFSYSKANTSNSDLILQAEQAIQNITTLQAEFIQISSDGSYAIGTLYLRRPFQMRLEYDSEDPFNLITTRRWLIVDEPGDKRVSNYPISETPFAPLLKDTVSLTGADFITYSRISDGLAEIILEKETGESAGKLVLQFEPKRMQLRGWILSDTLGVETKVTLQNEIYGKKLANKLFGPPIY